jgi:hypothetical protein
MTEDWAEIRRLHRSERMSIKAIVRGWLGTRSVLWRRSGP